MSTREFAAAFEAVVRYSRSERHDDALAVWRKTLHEAAGREDDLPFKAFSDWLEERDLASPEMLQRLRSDGAHATPTHFAQHPETGEVVEWPRRGGYPFVPDADTLRSQPTATGDWHYAVHGPQGIHAVANYPDGYGQPFAVHRLSDAGRSRLYLGHYPTMEEAKQAADHAAFSKQA